MTSTKIHSVYNITTGGKEHAQLLFLLLLLEQFRDTNAANACVKAALSYSRDDALLELVLKAPQPLVRNRHTDHPDLRSKAVSVRRIDR